MVTASGPTLTSVQKALILEDGMDERRILDLAGQYAVKSTINDTGMMLAAGFVGENAMSDMPTHVKGRIERLVLHGAFGEADRVFVEAIKDLGAFDRWKTDAERIEAFNSAVARLTARVQLYRRFLELGELDSYKSGVFLKNFPWDVNPDRFVSFTVGFRHIALEKRRESVDFPAEPMRCYMVPVRYSPFLRINDSRTELILDEKDVQFAYEAEARIRINSRVPKNLQITIRNIRENLAINVVKRYGDLGSVKFG